MTPELWPARLHHLRRDSPKPEPLARFYAELLGDRVEALPGGSWLVAGRGRRLVLGQGPAASVPYFALEMQDAAHLDAFRRRCKAEPFSTPLFTESFALTDPDGRKAVFGLAKSSSSEQGLPGRLQHFVCATTRLDEMLAFYKELGMAESDRVLENEELAAVFLRSDPEHHSFAAAARRLGRSPTAVTRMIGALEARLGVRLLNRTTRAVNVTKEKLDNVMKDLGMQEGFDVGLEMSGNPTAFRDMLRTMHHGGSVALLGIPPGDTAIDWNQVIFKGLNMRGIYGREMFETWYKMAALLQAGLDITPVITHHFPVQEFQKGFETMGSGQSGKVILDWSTLN